ncbi:hypothetical protein [Acidocella sp.]|uniref:hypothetical protein n=1 Tax=Acidocella sp. TaxID=50710 RepID=UPI002601D320|nr:hypothetical protein [Acidocella sp.]
MFVSKYVWYPHGFNFTWDTSIPFAALVILPITLLKGPVIAFNLLSVMAPALSAWTAFLLARQITHDWRASLIGGYLFGFSSYELAQLLGHLNLDLTFLVPLAVLLCVRRFQGEISRRLFIARKRGQTARRDSHDAVRCDSTLTSGTEVSVGSWIDERRRMGVFQAISG